MGRITSNIGADKSDIILVWRILTNLSFHKMLSTRQKASILIIVHASTIISTSL
jgi:hypothetical protein